MLTWFEAQKAQVVEMVSGAIENSAPQASQCSTLTLHAPTLPGLGKGLQGEFKSGDALPTAALRWGQCNRSIHRKCRQPRHQNSGSAAIGAGKTARQVNFSFFGLGSIDTHPENPGFNLLVACWGRKPAILILLSAHNRSFLGYLCSISCILTHICISHDGNNGELMLSLKSLDNRKEDFGFNFIALQAMLS